MARACLHVMEHHNGSEIVNIGAGEDVSIRELAELVGDVVGYEGELVFDTSKPDGTPRKLLDISRIRALGWEPTVSLRAGVESTYAWYLEHVAAGEVQGDGDDGIAAPRGLGSGVAAR
jgi:GDP-L-fucose synthase